MDAPLPPGYHRDRGKELNFNTINAMKARFIVIKNGSFLFSLWFTSWFSSFHFFFFNSINRASVLPSVRPSITLIELEERSERKQPCLPWELTVQEPFLLLTVNRWGRSHQVERLVLY